MMHNIMIYFILFLSFAFIGWLLETTACSIKAKKYINRGFLIGPYCPIYGFGALIMIVFLSKYLHDPLVLFFMALISTTILEYFTSYIMEKIFKARWWDYSNRKFNINGRIYLGNSIIFGILGIVLMYIVYPFWINVLTSADAKIINIIGFSLLFLFLIDFVISANIIVKLEKDIKLIKKDYTEEISNQVMKIIQKQLVLKRRLIKAFPNIKFFNENIYFNKIKSLIEKRSNKN